MISILLPTVHLILCSMKATLHFTESELYNYVSETKYFQVCFQMIPTKNKWNFQVYRNHTTTIDQYKYLNTYLFCSIDIRTLMHVPPPVLSICYHSDTYKNFSTCNQDLQPPFLSIKWWCTKIPILMNFYILKLHYLLKTKELGLTL